MIPSGGTAAPGRNDGLPESPDRLRSCICPLSLAEHPFSLRLHWWLPSTGGRRGKADRSFPGQVKKTHPRALHGNPYGLLSETFRLPWRGQFSDSGAGWDRLPPSAAHHPSGLGYCPAPLFTKSMEGILKTGISPRTSPFHHCSIQMVERTLRESSSPPPMAPVESPERLRATRCVEVFGAGLRPALSRGASAFFPWAAPLVFEEGESRGFPGEPQKKLARNTTILGFEWGFVDTSATAWLS